MKAIIKQYTIWESEEHLAYKSKQLKIKIRHAKHIFTALIHIFYISSNLINICNFFFHVQTSMVVLLYIESSLDHISLQYL